MSLPPRAFRGLSRFLAPSAGGPLADRALAEGLISAAQLQQCLDEQDRSGRPLDEILVERGFLTAEDAARLRPSVLPPEVVDAARDPSRLLGHYVLLQRIGSGGMADVWKAWDRSLGRWVAVKLLKKEVGHPTQRIEREGRMAGGLAHPSIITIFERGIHDGRPYLVMPFVDGRPPQAPLTPREAARVALEVAGALEHAHAQGVLHRDVKPANILVERSGRVLLADFGLAIPSDAGVSRWAVSGTPEYASPEQIRGEVLDDRTDVYSLGATLAHLLTGRPPFAGRDAAHISEQVLSGPLPRLAGVPRALARIVRRAMERDLERRYPSISPLRADLQRWLESARPPRVALLVGVLLASLLPWAGAVAYVLKTRAADRALTIQNLLEEGRRALAGAEGLQAVFPPGSPALEEAVERARLLFDQVRVVGDGGTPEAEAGLARCHELLGREAEADEGYRRAGDFLSRARLRVRAELEGRGTEGRRSEARGYLAAVGEGRRDDAWRVYSEVAAGRWEGAWEAGRPVLEKGTRDVVLQAAVGRGAIAAGRWEEAVRALERAAAMRKADASLAYWKGVALAGKGDREASEKALRESLRLAPTGWPLRADAERRLSGSSK